MKIITLCRECGSSSENQLFGIEIRDQGFYNFKCQYDHENFLWLQNNKFEILFDSACLALLDGYAREAVAGLAASLERFLEFYCRVILTGEEVSADQIEETWRLVSNQSERQLGAFFFLYLLENKISIKYLSNENVKFRNKVVHKGYIPTYKEVLNYGDDIYKFINNLLTELKKSKKDIMNKLNMEASLKASLELNTLAKTSSSIQIGTQYIPTILSTISLPDETPNNFEEAISYLKDLRERAYAK